MNKKPRTPCLVMLLGILCFTCEKDTDLVSPGRDLSEVSIPDLQSPSIGQLASWTPCTYFDWENEDYIYSAYLNNYVDLPWRFGASGLDPNTTIDHLKEDGWELVYNSFQREYPARAYPYLIFYNKFRGILRAYYLHTQQASSTQLIFAMMVRGTTSLFNNNAEFPNPSSSKETNPYLINANYTPIGPSGASFSNWYMFDFDLSSYDPGLKGKSTNDVMLMPFIWNETTSKITISGNLTADISGTLNIYNKSSTSFSFDFNQNQQTNNVSFGTSNKSDGKNGFLKYAGKQLKTGLGNALKGAANQLASNSLNFLTNPVTKMFASLIGVNGNNNSVNLKLNGKINLSGSLSTQTAVLNGLNEVIPGSVLSNNGGYEPCGDIASLGVWSVNGVPQVSCTIRETCDLITHLYNLDLNSFDVVINPDILPDLTSVTVKKELYFLKSYKGQKHSWTTAGVHVPTINNSNCTNSEGGNTWFRTSGLSFEKYTREIYPIDKMYVRVEITLHPDGSDPVTHVKFIKPSITLDSYSLVCNGGGGDPV